MAQPYIADKQERMAAKAKRERAKQSDIDAAHWYGCKSADSIEIVARKMPKAREARRQYKRISHITLTRPRFSTI